MVCVERHFFPPNVDKLIKYNRSNPEEQKAAQVKYEMANRKKRSEATRLVCSYLSLGSLFSDCGFDRFPSPLQRS